MGRCRARPACAALLQPDVVWFGGPLDPGNARCGVGGGRACDMLLAVRGLARGGTGGQPAVAGTAARYCRCSGESVADATRAPLRRGLPLGERRGCFGPVRRHLAGALSRAPAGRFTDAAGRCGGWPAAPLPSLRIYTSAAAASSSRCPLRWRPKTPARGPAGDFAGWGAARGTECVCCGSKPGGTGAGISCLSRRSMSRNWMRSSLLTRLSASPLAPRASAADRYSPRVRWAVRS